MIEFAEGSPVEREAIGGGTVVALRCNGFARTAGDRRSDSRLEQEHRATGASDHRGQFGTGA